MGLDISKQDKRFDWTNGKKQNPERNSNIRWASTGTISFKNDAYFFEIRNPQI